MRPSAAQSGAFFFSAALHLAAQATAVPRLMVPPGLLDGVTTGLTTGRTVGVGPPSTVPPPLPPSPALSSVGTSVSSSAAACWQSAAQSAPAAHLSLRVGTGSAEGMSWAGQRGQHRVPTGGAP